MIEEIAQDLVEQRDYINKKISTLTSQQKKISAKKKELNNLVKDIDKTLSIYAADVRLKPVNVQNAKALGIAKVVAEFFGMSIDEMMSKNRKSSVVLARQLYFYLAKKHTTLVLKSIPLGYKSFDHSIVLFSINKIQDYIDVNHPRNKDPEDIIKNLEQIESYL